MKSPTEQDAERFLSALEGSIQELLTLSKVPIANPEQLKFDEYKKFRDKTDECLSFLVIIEGRIGEVEGERKELLTEQFDKLVVATWSVLMEGSFGFLSVLSEREYLPIGTKHVFQQELKTLSEAEEVMTKNQNKRFLSSNMTERRTKARNILDVVIERAPELLNMDALLDGDPTPETSADADSAPADGGDPTPETSADEDSAPADDGDPTPDTVADAGFDRDANP